MGKSKKIHCNLPGISDHPEILNWLGEYKCKLNIHPSATADIFLEVSDASKRNIQNTTSRIKHNSDNPRFFLDDIKNLRQETIAIYVELSKVLTCGSLKVCLENLIELVKGLRTATRKFVGGSLPCRNTPLWEVLENDGFTIDFLTPIKAGTKYAEEAVDDLIHSRIRTEIHFEYRSGVSPPKIIILSGDGNENSGRTSFPMVIEEALRRPDRLSFGHGGTL